MTMLRTVCLAGLVSAGSLAVSSAAFAVTPQSGALNAEFKRMDTDRNGRISGAEHTAGAKWMFEMMDANRDDKVTAREMTTAQRRVTGRKPKNGDMSSAAKIKVVDTDGDGVLSKQEHTAGSDMMFALMDTSKDGSITRAELAAGHASMLRKRSR